MVRPQESNLSLRQKGTFVSLIVDDVEQHQNRGNITDITLANAKICAGIVVIRECLKGHALIIRAQNRNSMIDIKVEMTEQ